MDAVRNPFAPGAGTPPPELAGRDEIIEESRIALGRIKIGKPAQPIILFGLRGVGKTVLLRELHKRAEKENVVTIFIETPENKEFFSLLLPEVRAAHSKLSRIAAVGDKARRAAVVLRNMLSSLKIEIEGIGLSIEAASDSDVDGQGKTGDIERDLGALLQSMGEAAKERQAALFIFLDEMQYLEEKQLAALISALHLCNQLQLPVSLVGAGLPQIRGKAGSAKSYSERLFKFYEIGPLSDEAARTAIELPIQKEGEAIEDEAIKRIIALTKGYAYFIQEWASRAWLVAERSPITVKDVELATTLVIPHLDQSFFAVRFDRCTPSEKSYMLAMAELGGDTVRSGDVAAKLGKAVHQVAPVRNQLLKKGMIYSPAHGDNAFTVPMFGDFLRRKSLSFSDRASPSRRSR